MPSYLQRTLEDPIRRLSGEFAALLVTGPRQSGKTTLLRHLAGQARSYVTLDDLALRALAAEDPRLFLDRFPAPVLIDEIQYAPALLPYIKIRIDQGAAPGDYWLTGSQQFQMMKGVTETLAGRVAVLNLLGFACRERHGNPRAEPFLPATAALAHRADSGCPTSAGALFREIWTGSFPALQYGRRDRDVYLSSYLQTYIQRDVRDLTQVGDLDRFTRFVSACAARTAGLLNLADLARDVDVSIPTAKSWLSVLVASHQVFLLPPYHTNVTKRLVKTPKLYFLDTGLAAYLTGWTSAATLEKGAMAGALFETHVVAEVLKSWWHQGRSAPIYHYRDRDGREVDLLLDVDGMLHAAEIKLAATVRREWVDTFRPLGKLDRPLAGAAVLCLTPERVPLAADVVALPASVV